MSEAIIGLIGVLLGGISVALLQSSLEKKNQININLNKIMEDKYKSLLIFMSCSLDIKKKRYFTLNEQIPNKTSEDYMNQIKEYYYHSLLYSPDSVIKALKNFILNPCKENFIKTAIEMRKDLWNKGTNLTIPDIEID